MKKIYTLFIAILLQLNIAGAQCSFESLFPFPWETSKFEINQYYTNQDLFEVAYDTINFSSFQHGLDYLFTARNFDLAFYSYKNIKEHPCFLSGATILNCVANDSGLVAYFYKVKFPVGEKAAYLQTVDSLKDMMSKKFVYNTVMKNPTKATTTTGEELDGEGVSVYFNNEPVIHTNLTYAPFVIRSGYLASKPPKSNDNGVYRNQAEKIEYYLIEILYKKQAGK